MYHRVTHTLVGIVTVVLVGASVAFGLAVTAIRRAGTATPVVHAAVPPVMHPTQESMAACTRCHAAGRDGLPLTHTTYGASTCLTCHRPARARPERASRGTGDGQPRPVPHPVGGRHDDCRGCHAIGGNLGMPEDHADFAAESCTGCHAGPSGAGPEGAGSR